MITDESIPDAVYVKGNLATDSAGERSTVFIDGHGSTGETISVEAAAAATRIEPRLRDRRLAVKRAAGRKRIKWALIAAVVIAVVVGGLAVLGSSLFAVEDVEVEGAVYTDERALAAVVADLEGTPVLRVDTDAAERELEAIPWVEDARVTTDFPDRGEDRDPGADPRGRLPGGRRPLPGARRRGPRPGRARRPAGRIPPAHECGPAARWRPVSSLREGSPPPPAWCRP